jgi:hypothetical protein
VALAVAVAFVVFGPRPPLFGDAGDYIDAARSLLEGRGYPRESTLPFFRPPLYPALIALTWAVLPDDLLPILLGQAVLHAVTCGLLFRVAVQGFGDRLAAMVGATCYAVSPFALWQLANVQTEPLHTLLVASSMLFLTRYVVAERAQRRDAFLAGVFFGLASLCRPTALPVGLALCAGVGLARREGPVGARYLGPALMLLGLGLPIAPWTLANWRATHEWILITDGGGYHLWLGNHPAELAIYERTFRSRSEFDAYSYKYLQRDLPNAKIAEWEREAGYWTLTLKQREHLWSNEFRENLRRNKAATLRLVFYKVLAYWRPWLQPGAYPRTAVVGSGAVLVGLYGLALAGAGVVGRTAVGRRWLLLVAFLSLSSTVVHAATHVMMRFRLPYVDPYLFLLAGAAAAAFFRRCTGRPGLRLPAPLARLV